jgi:hypothetical protein
MNNSTESGLTNQGIPRYFCRLSHFQPERLFFTAGATFDPNSEEPSDRGGPASWSTYAEEEQQKRVSCVKLASFICICICVFVYL